MIQPSTADSHVQEMRARLGSISAADAIEQAANGPARRVLIDPLVAREETALLHSQPRDGKTWLMLAGGLAVANDEKFANRFSTVQANVLYCTNEDGQRAIANRVQMLMNGLDMKRAPDGFRLFVGRGLWLDEPTWQQRLIAEVLAFEIGLVMYEPLRSVTGCVDRGPADLQPLSLFERRLINETGCAIWRGHHETKPLTGIPDDVGPRSAHQAAVCSPFPTRPSASRGSTTPSRVVPDGFKHCDTPAPFIVERLTFEGACHLKVIDAPSTRPARISA